MAKLRRQTTTVLEFKLVNQVLFPHAIVFWQKEKPLKVNSCNHYHHHEDI